MEKLLEILKALPYPILAVGLGLYLGYDINVFLTSQESPLIEKKTDMDLVITQNKKLAKDIEEAKKFKQELNQKVDEIRNKALELDAMSTTLSEEIDMADFLKQINSTARIVGLRLLSTVPLQEAVDEFYVSQSVQVQYEGIFVQLLVFLEQISKLQSITRIDDFTVNLKGDNTKKLVPLSGNFSVKVYRYRLTSEDEIAGKAKKKEGSG